MIGSGWIAGVWADLQELVGLQGRISQATSDDEREDLYVDLQILRNRSSAVSILCSIKDMHEAHPLLLPLLGVGLALKYLF